MDQIIPKKLQKALSKANSPSEKFIAYEDLAEFHYNNQDYEKSLPYFQKELEAAIALDDEHKIAKAHRMIGEVLSLLGEYEQSLKHQLKYYEYAMSSEDSNRLPDQQRALTTLGRTYLIFAESLAKSNDTKAQKLFSKAQHSLLSSLKVTKTLEEKCIVGKSEISKMNAVSLLNLGVVYESQKDFEKASSNYRLALRLCRANELQSLRRRCCLNLASLLTRCHKVEDALRLFKEARECAKALPDHESIEAELEILIAEEEAHILNGDVYTARKVLQRAYRLRSNLIHDTESVEKTLKSDVAMHYALRSLNSGSNLTPEDEFKLYERLGDGFAARGVYKHALVHYEKMLECSKKAGLDLKPCYTSLAQTAKDLGRYEEAISYFEEEIAISSPKEACNSLLLVEMCQESLGAVMKDRLKTLYRAWDLVQETDDVKLKVDVLSRTLELQSKVKDPKVEETKLALQEWKSRITTDSSDSDESYVDGTQDIGEHIDLHALSDFSSENEQEYEKLENSGPPAAKRPKRNASRLQVNSTWRNEKGETKLHLACIRGNLNAVQTLVEQGCDVNATDFAGWTPLHEACNHGFEDIVHFLLNHGANINQHTPEGITPLYDAASAGNLEVIDILMKRNASVLPPKPENQTPLDALKDYCKRVKDSLTQEEQEQYDRMIDTLKSALDKVGYIPKNDWKYQEKNNDSVNKQIYSSAKVLSPSNVKSISGGLRRGIDELDPPSPLLFQRDLSPVSDSSHSSEHSVLHDNEVSEGVSEYQEAMKRIRRNRSVLEETPKDQKSPIPALISSSEVIDNWLDDDLRNLPTKRRKTLEHPKLPLSNYKPLSLNRKSNNRPSLNSQSSSRGSCSSRNSVGSLEDVRLSTGSCTRDLMEVGVSPIIDLDLDVSMTEDSIAMSTGRTSRMSSDHDDCINSFNVGDFQHPVTPLSYEITKKTKSPPQTTFQSVSQISSQVVNIHVEEVLLAIPVVDQASTIKWLSMEASKRFFERKGVSVKLEIQTAEGACLDENDPVSFFVGRSNLVGIVKDVVALTERYKDACQFFKVEVSSEILSALEQSQATQMVSIANGALPFFVMRPVFKAVSMEHNLSRINFSNNSIKDEGLSSLCDQIGRLINLADLDLSSNSLSSSAIHTIAETAKRGNLKCLVGLNLSFNDFHNSCVKGLSELTAAIPGLQSLALANCQFSKCMWSGHNHLLTLANLRSLDISGNMLEAKGVAGWLGYTDHDKNRRLDTDVLEVLHMVGVGGSHICEELELFYESAGVIALKELSISYPDMQDDDVNCLLRALKSAPRFKHLRIPVAPHVTGISVCKLIDWQPSLNTLEIKIGNGQWEGTSSEQLVVAAEVAAKGLKNLSLKGAPRIFEEVWNRIKGNGSVKRGALGLQVFESVPL